VRRIYIPYSAYQQSFGQERDIDLIIFEDLVLMTISMGCDSVLLWPPPPGLTRTFLSVSRSSKVPRRCCMDRSPRGGFFNLISKRPTLEPLHEIQLQTGSYDRIQGAFDLSGAIDKDGHFLYRLSGLGRSADTQFDHTEDQRLSIAPALTWQPGNDTTLTLLTSYQYDPAGGFLNRVPGQGAVLSNPNGEIPSSFYAGAPNFDDLHRTQYSVAYLFEHRFNDTWRVRQNFRSLHVDLDHAQVFSNGFLPDLRTLNRADFHLLSDLDTITLDNQAQATFTTGPLRHTFLFGIDYQRVLSDLRQEFGVAPPLDAFGPNYDQPIPPPSPILNQYQTQNQLGLYAQDHIKLGPWVLLLGGRHDWADSKTRDRVADSLTKQSDSAFTWRAGLVYLFDIGLAPYFSYSKSFEPVIGTDFFGNPFEPTTGQQYEVGIKYQPQGFNGFITLAGFQLTQ
jgi:iron complex outermembrane receptor protein